MRCRARSCCLMLSDRDERVSLRKLREWTSAGPRPKWPASDRQPKQLVDKLQLREWVTFAPPFGSPFPNHVDRLDSLQRPPRRRKRLICSRQTDALFRNAMVLLDHIV